MNAMTNHSVSFPPVKADDYILSIGINQIPALETTKIDIANMAAIDYVFLTPARNSYQSINNQESLSIVFQLIEQLQLSPERTTFIAIDTDDHNNRRFSRFETQWVDQFPIDIKCTPIVSRNHIDFIETLHTHASSYEF